MRVVLCVALVAACAAVQGDLEATTPSSGTLDDAADAAEEVLGMLRGAPKVALQEPLPAAAKAAGPVTALKVLAGMQGKKPMATQRRIGEGKEAGAPKKAHPARATGASPGPKAHRRAAKLAAKRAARKKPFGRKRAAAKVAARKRKHFTGKGKKKVGEATGYGDGGDSADAGYGETSDGEGYGTNAVEPASGYGGDAGGGDAAAGYGSDAAGAGYGSNSADGGYGSKSEDAGYGDQAGYGDSPAAPAAAPPASGSKTGCVCKGGQGECKDGEVPWCYIPQQDSCDDAMEECENGACQFWSEHACKPGASGDHNAAINGQHEALMKDESRSTLVDATAASGTCQCQGGSDYGNTCDASEEPPWCYVKSAAGCDDSVEECEGGSCKNWSEAACRTPDALHEAILKGHATHPTSAAGANCKCRGGTGEGAVCDASEDFPWCYVASKDSCGDGIEECEGDVCQFWSESACSLTAPAAPATPAPPAAAPAGSCTCRGGTGEGSKCEAGEFPWCYVSTKESCGDAIQECEGGVCEYWSETACKVTATGGEGVVAAQHASILKTHPGTGAAGANCQCRGGTGDGNTCVAGEWPWCYVTGPDSCGDAIEECEGGVCQFWSESPCQTATKVATAKPASKACECKGGELPGNTCVGGEKDNFGMGWCYVKNQDNCPDAVKGICESDHSCSYWSEAACGGKKVSKESIALKPVPATLHSPSGTCRCKGGADPGNKCEPAGTDKMRWCYVATQEACPDSVEGICKSDHSCSYWSELACHALPEKALHHHNGITPLSHHAAAVNHAAAHKKQLEVAMQALHIAKVANAQAAAKASLALDSATKANQQASEKATAREKALREAQALQVKESVAALHTAVKAVEDAQVQVESEAKAQEAAVAKAQEMYATKQQLEQLKKKIDLQSDTHAAQQMISQIQREVNALTRAATQPAVVAAPAPAPAAVVVHQVPPAPAVVQSQAVQQPAAVPVIGQGAPTVGHSALQSEMLKVALSGVNQQLGSITSKVSGLQKAAAAAEASGTELSSAQEAAFTNDVRSLMDQGDTK